MQSVIVRTKAVGYKGQDDTRIDFTYRFETRPNTFAVDLLGDTFEAVVFETFNVQGLDVLASNFESDCNVKPIEAKRLALEHMQDLVKSHIQTFSDYQRQAIACIVKEV